MRTAFLALLVILHLAVVRPAGATVANDICAPAANPCIVTTMRTVTSGSTLDFGARALEIKQGAKLDVGTGGSMTILAGSVILQPGSGLLGPGGSIVVHTSGGVSIRKTGNSTARIDVAGDDSSNIDITSTAGDVLVEGLLDASTTAVDQFAGDIKIAAMNVVIPGDLDIHGGRDGTAGTVTIDALGNLTLTGKVDGTSGDNFSVGLELNAGGNVICNASVDLQATKDGGNGGFLEISAGGSATLGGTVKTTGQASSEDIGDAGDVAVEAGGSIQMAGTLDLSGPPGGSGGGASFSAALDITQTGVIDAFGRGQDGSGGEITFDADRALTLGTITATGGDAGSGGFLDATAWCALSLPAGRTIDVRGPDGSITLASGGTAAGNYTIAGTLRSTSGNDLEYRTVPPTITGLVDPALPGARQVSTLIPCGGTPPANCGDSLLGAQEECDASAPSGSAACPGRCSNTCLCKTCGNGRLDEGEQCDDSNTASCDGCNATCSRRDNVCGDGVKECGEPADDNNVVSCDGVSSTCQVEACGNGVRECTEACDEGAAPTASCSGAPACTLMTSAQCGNGSIDAGEACDDSNTADCDGCSRFCQFDGCGSGSIDDACGEQCDDQNTDPGDGCNATCQIEECGNGVLDEGEVCDKGPLNGQATAGCSTTCETEFCGDDVVQSIRGEECDAGSANGTVGQACSATCHIGWCGNGIQEAGELCDAGARNGQAGSNCLAETCRPGPTCTAGIEEACIACADATECGGSGPCGGSACVAGVCTPVDAPSCDDGNACTTDTCHPTRGCEHVARTCPDTSTCDGVNACNPATGQCESGPAPDCGDADECTADGCTDTLGGFLCTNPTRPGVDGATCRAAALRSAVEAATDLPRGTRKKLLSLLKRVGVKLPIAGGTDRKGVRAQKQVASALKSVAKMIARAEGKLDADTFGKLNSGVTSTQTAVGAL